MPLFTVKMVRLQVISRYNDAGVKIAEETKEIPFVFHDLPEKTAVAYRTKFPDAKVEIEQQTEGASYGGAVEVGGRSTYSSKARERDYAEKPAKKAPARDRTTDAAERGDFAAAIDAAFEEAS